MNAATASSGSSVTVTAPGYLTRSQPSAPVVWLWPQAEAYVQPVVYTLSGSGIRKPLNRWAPGATIRIALAAGLERDKTIVAAVASEMSRYSKLSVLAVDASASPNVIISVEPARLDTNVIGQASVGVSGATIVGANVYFRSEANISGSGRNYALTHELGHVLGLEHSPDPGDVMSDAPNRRSDQTYGDQESRALTMMYSWRKAGNQFPDTEPVGLLSNERRTIVVSCAR